MEFTKENAEETKGLQTIGDALNLIQGFKLEVFSKFLLSSKKSTFDLNQNMASFGNDAIKHYENKKAHLVKILSICNKNNPRVNIITSNTKNISPTSSIAFTTFTHSKNKFDITIWVDDILIAEGFDSKDTIKNIIKFCDEQIRYFSEFQKILDEKI